METTARKHLYDTKRILRYLKYVNLTEIDDAEYGISKEDKEKIKREK